MLFNEPIDGVRAAELGLAWRAVPDDELLQHARSLAAGAARVPKPLTARTKETLRQVPWQQDFDAALATEVERQTWSLGQGWFQRPSQRR